MHRSEIIAPRAGIVALRSSRRGRALGAVAAALLALHLAAGAALGHAVLILSDPADGAWLPDAPREMRLWFSESVSADLSEATLSRADGRDYPVSLAAVPDDRRQLVVRVGNLPRGVFRLTWSSFSEDDVHRVTGQIVFGVREVVAGAGPVAPPSANPVQGVAAWLETLALALTLGAVAGLWLLGRPTAAAHGSADMHRALAERLARIGAVAAVLTVATGIGRLVAAVAGLDGAPGSDTPGLLATSWGQRWMLLELLAVVLAFVMVGGDRRFGSHAGRGRIAIAIVVLGAIFGVRAAGSHAAITNGGAIPDLLVSAVHAVAATAWAGTLAALVIATVPLLGRRGLARAAAVGLLRRFGPFAFTTLTVAVASGLLLAGGLVGSLDGLLLTPYGQLLLAKLAIASGGALLGLRHASTLHGVVRRWWLRLGGPRLVLRLVGLGAMRLTLRLEAAAAVVVIGVASLLSVTAPASAPKPVPADQQVGPAPVTGRADDLVVTAAVAPGRAGPNFISVGVFDSRRPSPGPVGEVRLQIRPTKGAAIDLVARAIGDGQFEANAVLPDPGDWEVSISVARDSLPVAHLAGSWAVTAVPPALPPETTGGKPIAPFLQAAAIGVAITGALGWLLVSRRVRPVRRAGGRALTFARQAVRR